MSTFVMPSTEKDRDRIKAAISEIVDHLTFIASYKEKIKEINDFLKEEFELPASLANKSAALVYKGSFFEEEAKFAELEEINNLVAGT